MGKDGVVIPGTLLTEPATDGGTLQLTINRDLQWYLQQMIAEEVQNQVAQRGTAFVVEVATGKVRAAAEYPTVDPNDVDASEPRGPRQPHLHDGRSSPVRPSRPSPRPRCSKRARQRR